MSAQSKPNTRSGRGSGGLGVGGRGQGGPDKSDIVAMGVVGGLGGEIEAGAPAAKTVVAVGTERGVVMRAEVVGWAAAEESFSSPPTCGGAGS